MFAGKLGVCDGAGENAIGARDIGVSVLITFTVGESETIFDDGPEVGDLEGTGVTPACTSPNIDTIALNFARLSSFEMGLPQS